MNTETLKEIAGVIEKFAPSIAGSLLGPAPALAIQLLETIFGVRSDTLSSAISADNSAGDKLKELELNFQSTIANAQAQAQEFASQVSDKESARDREEKIIQMTGKRDWVLSFLAIVFVLFFFVICILNYFFTVKDDHVLIMLTGQISAGVGYLLSYYFGSTSK